MFTEVNFIFLNIKLNVKYYLTTLYGKGYMTPVIFNNQHVNRVIFLKRDGI